MMTQDRWVSILKREKALLIGGLAFSLVLMFLYVVFFYTPMYQSTSKIYIRNIGNENVLSSFGSGSPIKSESNYSNPLFNYQAVLESERMADRLYKRLEEKYPKELKLLGIESEEQWAAYYATALSSNIVSSTDIIKIKFEWPNERHAKPVLNALIKEYKSLNLDIQKSTVGTKSERIDVQLEKVTQELEAIRTEIKNYMRDNKAVDLTVESSQLTQSRVQLQQELESIESEIAYNRQKLAELKKLLKFKSVDDALDASSVGEDPYLIGLYKDLADAQKELDKLRARFEDAYPAVQTAIKEVESVQNKIDQRVKEATGKEKVSRGAYNKVSNSLIEELANAKAQMSALEARRSELQNGIDRIQQRELSIPEKQRYLNELQKEEQALKEAYSQLKSSAMESKIKDKALIDNLFVLSAPSSGSLVKKSLFIQLFAFLFFGLFLGALAAWIKDNRQDRWTNTQEIEGATNKVVLGKISWQPDLNEVPGQLRGQKDNSETLREYTNAVASLMQRSYLEEAQVISFVSTSNVRTQSNMVRNLALSMGLSQRKVLLVDTDLESPLRHFQFKDEKFAPPASGNIVKLVQHFNQANRLNAPIDMPTFDALANECITTIDIPGTDCSLDYLSAASPVARTYDYVASLGFEQLLEHLKQRYEFILLDTPAAPHDYPETQAVMTRSQAVTVLSAYETGRHELMQTIRFLDKTDLKTLGIIARL